MEKTMVIDFLVTLSDMEGKKYDHVDDETVFEDIFADYADYVYSPEYLFEEVENMDVIIKYVDEIYCEHFEENGVTTIRTTVSFKDGILNEVPNVLELVKAAPNFEENEEFDNVTTNRTAIDEDADFDDYEEVEVKMNVVTNIYWEKEE